MSASIISEQWADTVGQEIKALELLGVDLHSIGGRLKLNSAFDQCVRAYCCVHPTTTGHRFIPQTPGLVDLRLLHSRFRIPLAQGLETQSVTGKLALLRRLHQFLVESSEAQQAADQESVDSLAMLVDECATEAELNPRRATRKLKNVALRTEHHPLNLYWLADREKRVEHHQQLTLDELVNNYRKRVEVFYACASLTALDRVNVDGGMQVPCSLTVRALWLCFLPLCEWICRRAAQLKGNRRLVVGVVAPGGAGKTTFVALLARVLTQFLQSEYGRSLLLLPVQANDGDCPLQQQQQQQAIADDRGSLITSHEESLSSLMRGASDDTEEHDENGLDRQQQPGVVTLSMDAYHHTNEWLDREGLRSQKGAPVTFDEASFCQDLDRIRAVPRKHVSLPVYDRQLHNPRVDAVACGLSDRIVLMDGLWLLHTASFRQRIDVSVYLDVDEELRRDRIVWRKVHAPGAQQTVQQAVDYYHRVDAASARLVEQESRPHATVALTLGGERNDFLGHSIPALDAEETVFAREQAWTPGERTPPPPSSAASSSTSSRNHTVSSSPYIPKPQLLPSPGSKSWFSNLFN